MVQPWLEKITGRIAVSDFARRVQVEHLGGDAVIIPNGVHVAAFAEGPPLPGYARGSTGRRSASSAGSTSRARGWRSCSRRCGCVVRGARAPGCSSPAAATGRGLRALSARTCAAHVAPARRGLRGGQGRVPAAVDVYCAPNLAGRVLRHRPHRGDGRRRPGRRQRPGRVRPGARATATAGVLVPRGDAGAWPGRCRDCSPTRRGGPSSTARAARVAAELRLGVAGPAHPAPSTRPSSPPTAAASCTAATRTTTVAGEPPAGDADVRCCGRGQR